MDTPNLPQQNFAVNVADHIHITPEDRRRRRVCARKCKFRNISTALRALNRAISRGESNMSIYRCDYCGSWHLGHAPRSLRP